MDFSKFLAYSKTESIKEPTVFCINADQVGCFFFWSIACGCPALQTTLPRVPSRPAAITAQVIALGALCPHSSCKAACSTDSSLSPTAVCKEATSYSS